jgi:hypothetical protein
MHKYLIITIIATLCASCSVGRRVTIHQPVEWQVETPSTVRVNCTATNCSPHGVVVRQARLRLHYPAGDYATVLLGEPVTLARCGTSTLSFPLRVRFADPLTMLATVAQESIPVDRLLVSGEVVVKVGGVGKKIRIEGRPLSQILDTFAQGEAR